MRALVLIFITAATVAYVPLSLLNDTINERRQSFIVSELDSVQSRLEERFHLYSRTALALSHTAAIYWQQANVTPAEFAAIGETILSINPEAIGANFITPTGLISQVYPPADNASALGRVSQNSAALLEAERQRLSIWLSPPFKLFQGEEGFVYYFALRKQGKLQGWYGVVVSKARVLRQFLANRQFETVDVALSDSRTGLSYVQTAPLPRDKKYLRTTVFETLGQKLILQSWVKDSTIFAADLPLASLAALLVALFVTLSAHFFRLRRQSQRHVTQMNELLDHVIQDTSDSVATVKGHVEMMRSDPRLVPLERMATHVSFVVELLEQIKVMRGLAGARVSWRQEHQPVLPLILDVLELFSDQLRQQGLIVDYDPELLGTVHANLNPRLFVHAALSNVFGVFLRASSADGTIGLTAVRTGHSWRLRVSSLSAQRKLERADELSLAIAQKSMQIQGSSLEQVSMQPLTIDLLLPS